MSEKLTWQEQLKNIWDSLEEKPGWGFQSWEEVQDNFSDWKKSWEDNWKNKIADKLKDVDNYYKIQDSQYESIVPWVRDHFFGSYGMSDRPGALFGKSTTYTIEDAKKEIIDIADYAKFFEDCMKEEKMDDINKLQKPGFSAWGFLRKMLIANKYFDGKFEFIALYSNEKIKNLQKVILSETSYDEKRYFEINQKIFNEAAKLLQPFEHTVKDCVRLTNSLDILISNATVKDFPTKKQPNVIFYGAPGTGKTYAVRNMLNVVCQGDENRYRWVQFHPSFSYEDFIEGFKPSGVQDNSIKLELTNGVFKELCIKAKNDLTHEYYFVADEINRANLSSVFGETLSLLETDYRDNPLVPDKRHLVSTPYTTIEKNRQDKSICYDESGKFGIPCNIRFIGMMNDVDKSIDSFDLALRRRFRWIRKDCDYEAIEKVLKDEGIKKIDEYKKACKDLNNYISSENGLGLGKSYEFGHSFFMKITEFVNKKGTNASTITDSSKERLFKEFLLPTLKEYLRSFCTENELDSKLADAKKKFIS